ncbi:MAG: histone deacetylase [Candidatus Saccharibacteria bacterium]
MYRGIYIESGLSSAHSATKPHVESQKRLDAIRDTLVKSDLSNQIEVIINTDESPISDLELVHGQRLLRKIARASMMAGQRDQYLDSDTYITQYTPRVLQNSTSCVQQAVNYALEEKRNAFCSIRPPGHHAGRDYVGGFCLANFSAYAAEYARSKKVEKIAIIDWDAHHGNGTQSIFLDSSDVFYFSQHVGCAYPFKGSSSEKGRNVGLGYTLNIPLAIGVDDAYYIERFQSGLEQMQKKIDPDLIVISAGFDAHIDDPVGSLNLSSNAFGTLTDKVIDTWPERPIVSILEGGYNLDVLGRCALSHMSALYKINKVV